MRAPCFRVTVRRATAAVSRRVVQPGSRIPVVTKSVRPGTVTNRRPGRRSSQTRSVCTPSGSAGAITLGCTDPHAARARSPPASTSLRERTGARDHPVNCLTVLRSGGSWICPSSASAHSAGACWPEAGVLAKGPGDGGFDAVGDHGASTRQIAAASRSLKPPWRSSTVVVGWSTSALPAILVMISAPLIVADDPSTRHRSRQSGSARGDRRYIRDANHGVEQVLVQFAGVLELPESPHSSSIVGDELRARGRQHPCERRLAQPDVGASRWRNRRRAAGSLATLHDDALQELARARAGPHQAKSYMLDFTTLQCSSIASACWTRRSRRVSVVVVVSGPHLEQSAGALGRHTRQA
jgi:hypothetical protein